MLESEEAARRLGIKVTTLYAYVSRGSLTSYPSPTSRRSLFDLEEVEALAKRSRAGKRVESRLASVTTGVTQLRDDGPHYRGIAVSSLAGTATFEEVAELLWKVPKTEGAEWEAVHLPPAPKMTSSSRLSYAVLMCGAADTLRSDLRPEAVTQNARRLIATAARLAGEHTERAGTQESVAERLSFSLTGDKNPALVKAVDTALVLLADHELATSTMAVRLAASTRADVYEALVAGLATISGPYHGGASEVAFGLLTQAQRIGAAAAVDATLRWQRLLPGFGHAVYTAGDPRYPVLERALEPLAQAGELELVKSVVELATAHSMAGPNIDLGLAALMLAAGLPPDAGRSIFSIARLAGWTAHYLEELSERPLRFRARAVYASGKS